MKPYKHTVQYYETDKMGIAHHANYIHWMEEARVDFMEQIGYSYAEMEQHGVFSPVKGLSCEYRHPISFHDEIEITVTIAAFNGARLVMQYEGRMGETEIFTARSEHVFVDEKGMILRLKRAVPELSTRITELLSEHTL